MDEDTDDLLHQRGVQAIVSNVPVPPFVGAVLRFEPDCIKLIL